MVIYVISLLSIVNSPSLNRCVPRGNNCYVIREILLRNYGTKITSRGIAFSA